MIKPSEFYRTPSIHHCLMRLRRPQHGLEGAVPLGGARDAWRVAEGGAPEALGSEKGGGNATENGWVLTR